MPLPCTIRPYVDADWTELYAAVKESEAQLAPWLPWCHPAYSELDARSWIRATMDGHAMATMFDFAILDATGRFVGACGVNQIMPQARCANLGYWVRTSACGQGLATSAALQVCRWTFAHTRLNRLEILVAVGNLPSQRVAHKFARHEGILRSRLMLNDAPSDAVVFSVVRGDLPVAATS